MMAGCRAGQVRLLSVAPERLMLEDFLEPPGALEPGAAGGG
ncbi:hypothetical protein ACVXG7_04275 [Enterobacter hormaechei]